MMLETLMKMCVTEQDFFGKFFRQKNWGNRPKIGLLESKEKFGR